MMMNQSKAAMKINKSKICFLVITPDLIVASYTERSSPRYYADMKTTTDSDKYEYYYDFPEKNLANFCQKALWMHNCAMNGMPL
jgi:hypothetical protein